MRIPGRAEFERAMDEGYRCYDELLGEWWEGQASNPSHRNAYKRIANFVAWQIHQRRLKTRWLVDYACGTGAFLMEIIRRLPRTKLVGLDGSNRMLSHAIKRATRARILADYYSISNLFEDNGARLQLGHTFLPDFSVPGSHADVVSFVLPNIVTVDRDERYLNRHGYKNHIDVRVAKALSEAREADPSDRVNDMEPDTLFESMMTERLITKNIHQILRKGGLFIKAEYGQGTYEEMTDLWQARCLFSAGALEELGNSARPAVYFKYLRSVYFRSRVIEDVYHQTRNRLDRKGGFIISVYQAV
jgi:SAM-dependent methyltransferase